MKKPGCGARGYWVFLFALCAALRSAPAWATPECWAVFDAGSSGTRLYFYEAHRDDAHRDDEHREDANRGGASGGRAAPADTPGLRFPPALEEFRGPTAGALADPLRGLRGASWADVGRVVEEVAALLPGALADGPPGEEGAPRWRAFDWRARCRLRAVLVLATAGMRLGEQEEPERASALWGHLADALRKTLVRHLPRASEVPVTLRTLRGYEEGLYAWLALAAQQDAGAFGIVELGGASMQIAFPCEACPDARAVRVGDQTLRIYSHSFLGLGVDEAWRLVGDPAACAHGVGMSRAAAGDDPWQPGECAREMLLGPPGALRDPRNYQAGVQGPLRILPAARAEVPRWYATGALAYLREDDVERCCVAGDSCYQAESSCFRAVYSRTLLAHLGVHAPTPRRVSWTLGAALCARDDCLDAREALPCDWRAQGCLDARTPAPPAPWWGGLCPLGSAP